MAAQELHPYSVLGGGPLGEVHGPVSIVARPDFLVCLPPDLRRFLTLKSGHKLFYARTFGGELRERQAGESDEDAGPIKIVLVQGLAGTHVTWMAQLEYFASKPEYDIVSLDPRGVGFSDTPNGRFRTSDMADDVNSLIDHLQWTNVHLVGFSLGGMCALEAALHAPHQFQSVSLLSTHAGGLVGTIFPPHGLKPFLGTFASLGGVGALDAGMELLHAKHYLDTPVPPPVPQHLVDLAQTSKFKGPITRRFETAHDLIQQARKFVESEAFPEIRIEGTLKQMTAAATHYVSWHRLEYLKQSGIHFLVAGGRHDNLINYLNQPLLSQALGARKLILKMDSGHAVTMHHREEINEALEELFTKTRPVAKPVQPLRPQLLHPWVAFLATVFIVMRWTSGGRLEGVSAFKRMGLALAAASMVVRVQFGPLMI